MTLKRITILLAITLLTIGLAACELSASTPPPPSPTSGGGMSTLEVELGNIATQTAAAGGSVGVPTTTPTTGPDTGPEEPEESEESTDATSPPPATPTPEQPAVTVPPPTPGLPATYTVQKGEFPFCIARRFNLNQTELLNLNGLGINSRVPIGFILKIPQTGNPFSGVRPLVPHPTTYNVVAGDTIYTVACTFGDVSPDAIVQANNLTSPYTLTPGQTLQIP